MWTREEGIALCKAIEPIVATFGCHIALTGGLLYKDGKRKDCDLIVYRAGQDFGDEPRGSFSESVDQWQVCNRAAITTRSCSSTASLTATCASRSR